MAELKLLVTSAGRMALVNAANTGTAAVTITSVGFSAQTFAHGPATTTLPGEIKRVTTISGDVVADDTIHLIARDDSDGVYTVRAFALYLADGTLFAVYSQAAAIIEKSAMALLLLALDVRFADVAATSLAFGDTDFLNPPATESREGVARFATDVEAKAGTSLIRLLSPKRAKDAILSWLGFTPVRQGGGSGQGSNTVNIGWSGSRLKAQVDASDLGPIVFDSHIADVWRLTNDGAGSGLDADQLDGREGGWYADIAARQGFTSANRAGDVFTGDVAVSRTGSAGLSVNSLGVVIGRLVAQADGVIVLYRDSGGGGVPILSGNGSTVNIGAPLTRQGGKVWDVGNDGAGSGLDADLLDGRDGGWYADIPARQGFTSANAEGQIFSGPIGPEDGFRMVFSEGNPGIQFTADGKTSVFFNRSTRYFTFYVDDRAVFDVDVNGNARFRGSVTQNVAF